MRQLTIIGLVLSLAVISGCCCGKRESELCSPTDIRKTHFWCFGEDALFRYPCGPKPEFYGSEPTCWREWPASGAEWRDAFCAPPCQPEMPVQVESNSAAPNIQPAPAAQPETTGPIEPAPLEKAEGRKEPLPAPATGSTGLMEWPQREDVLMPRTRGLRPLTQRSYLEQAELQRPISISFDERPAPIAQPTAPKDILPASFTSDGASSLPARTTGPSRTLEPCVSAVVAPIPTTHRPEPSANGALAQEAALKHAISYGDGAATIPQSTVSQDSSTAFGAVSDERPIRSGAVGPSEPIETRRRIDTTPTTKSSCVEPDANQSLDQEAALRRAISF